MKSSGFQCLAILALGFCGGGAIAQEEFAGRSLGTCIADISEHCETVKRGGGRVIRCLQAKREALSPDCATTMFPTDYPGGTEGVVLTIEITNVRSKDGFIFVTLGDDPDMFPAGRRTVIAPASTGTVSVTFKHLKPGRYAVLTFHDENDNGQLDMLNEGAGTSNDQVGMPDFEASAVKVTGDAKLAVSMNYL